MTDTLSLGPVLDLIERLKACDRGSAYEQNVMLEVRDLDIPALRQLAEQHAAQLRTFALAVEDSSYPFTAEDVFCAADFLAAPRRKQEAE